MSDELLDRFADELSADRDPLYIAALELWNKRQPAWQPIKRYHQLDLEQKMEVEACLSELFRHR